MSLEIELNKLERVDPYAHLAVKEKNFNTFYICIDKAGYAYAYSKIPGVSIELFQDWDSYQNQGLYDISTVYLGRCVHRYYSSVYHNLPWYCSLHPVTKKELIAFLTES